MEAGIYDRFVQLLTGCLFSRWEWRWIRRLRLTAGGFGVLAGDTLRAVVDLGVLMIGITFVHRISPDR